MKTKKILFILLSALFLLTFNACSDDEETAEANPLVGTWIYDKEKSEPTVVTNNDIVSNIIRQNINLTQRTKDAIMALEKPPTEPAFHQYDKYDEFIIFDVEKMYHTTLRYAGEPQPLDFSLIASQNPYRADKDSLIMNVGSYGGIYDDPIKVGYTLSDGELTMDYNLTKEYDKDKIASLLSSAGVNNIDPEEVEVNKVVDRRVYGLFYGK